MNDDVALSVLCFELCHVILLGGNGPFFKVSDILDFVKQVPVGSTESKTQSQHWHGACEMMTNIIMAWPFSPLKVDQLDLNFRLFARQRFAMFAGKDLHSAGKELECRDCHEAPSNHLQKMPGGSSCLQAPAWCRHTSGISIRRGPACLCQVHGKK